MNTPILYSLQNCPYAMRARMGLLQSGQTISIRAISLKNKPQDMLQHSPKGTVPVLILPNGEVIDESLDIMIWALSQCDPNDLLCQQDDAARQDMNKLIAQHEQQFQPTLSRYKHAARYHHDDAHLLRSECEVFIAQLEDRLHQQGFFVGNQPCLADFVILPFIRQFARVERQWYRDAPYPKLKAWLNTHLQSRFFAKIMTKHSLWLDTGEAHLLE